MNREPKEDELYHAEGIAGWCRHGIVVIHNIGTKEKPDLVAVDTYWGGGTPNFGALERNFYPITEAFRQRLTFILDLGTARKAYEDEWEVFADEDRAFIPMGGSSAQYWLRKDARPSYPRQVARLERLIRQEDGRAESAARSAQRYREDLQKLTDSTVHRPGVMGPCSTSCSICQAALGALQSTT